MNDVIIGVVYISSINSTYAKSLAEPVWDILERELLQFENNEQILLAGDFNAHTGSLPDYIVNDDDVFSPVSNQYIADMEMNPRINCDKNVCTYGRVEYVHMVDDFWRYVKRQI